MKLFRKRESGQVLIIALILLALGSLLVVPLLRQSFTNLGYHQSIECQTLNSYSADAGLVYATSQIYMNPGTYLETPLDVSFELNGRTVNVTADYQGGGLFSVNSTASGGNWTGDYVCESGTHYVGPLYITGGGYGSENIPVITALTGYIDLVGPVVDAVLYAPEGQVRVQNCQLFGAMGGANCIVSNAFIRYSQSLHGRQDLPGSELFPLTYGYE